MNWYGRLVRLRPLNVASGLRPTDSTHARSSETNQPPEFPRRGCRKRRSVLPPDSALCLAGRAALARELARVLIETARPFGITILRNDIRELEGLQIVGLDDLWASQFRPELALGRLDLRRAAVVLSHNPDTVICRDGTAMKGGSCRDIRTGDSASRRFFPRRCCRFATGGTPPGNLR